MSINDPQWGRNAGQPRPTNANSEGGENDDRRSGADDARENGRPAQGSQAGEAQNREQGRQQDYEDERAQGASDDPRRRGQTSDLDQLWDDFNRMLGSLMGGARNGRRPGPGRDNDGAREDNERFSRGDEEARRGAPQDDRREESRFERPDARAGAGSRGPGSPRGPFGRRSGGRAQRASGRSLLLLCAVAVVGWAASGIYIVPEGQVGVVTTFGRYTKDSAAGINWRAPWPIQDVEIVDVSSVRKAEIGINGSTSRLREALMLTDDENIVDVQFNVQYRIKPHQAKDFLFRSRDPDQAVIGAAESAMREVVGAKKMDSVLFESKQEIAAAVQTLMQQMLDRYQTGIEVMSVAIQNAQPPQQVQAAFNDAVKAGQDRERQINEGQAYANAVVPAARGTASRLIQEAEGYKARVVETATGDAERFSMVLSQYEKAPEVTRERIYIDAMRDIYASTKKVLIDSKAGSNLLYLPLDKLLEKNTAGAAAASASGVIEPASAPAAPASAQAKPAASESSSALRRPAANNDDPRAIFRMRGE